MESRGTIFVPFVVDHGPFPTYAAFSVELVWVPIYVTFMKLYKRKPSVPKLTKTLKEIVSNS